MMEIIFVRHGQGEHNLNVPNRLEIEHPRLTEKGRAQVVELRSKLGLRENDLFISSPTIRTIETTNILTEELISPHKTISPLVGPRVFPLKDYSQTLKCDITAPISLIKEQYDDFKILEMHNQPLWEEGINLIPAELFHQYALNMINWINSSGRQRCFIISHDGTITAYREVLGERDLTRSDFLGEAGTYSVNLSLDTL